MSDPTPDQEPVLDPARELPEGVQGKLNAQTAADRAKADQLFGDIEAAGKKLEQAAYEDPLTGLSNRRALNERLDAILGAVVEPGPDVHEGEITDVTVLLLDIDHFKKLNDTYGHDVGDAALKAFGDYLRRTFDHPKHIIARQGGEEFAVIIAGEPEQWLFDRKLVREEREGKPPVFRLPPVPPIKVVTEKGEIELTISASAGTARFTRGENRTDFLRRADRAMYESKLSGRNCVTKFDDLPPDHRKHPVPERPPEPPEETS